MDKIRQLLKQFFVPLAVVMSFVACVPEEEIISRDSMLRLEFSQDTVLFDTLFTSLGSVTKRLMIRNTNQNALEINSVDLAGGQQSPYTIYLGGLEGDSFEDHYIAGGDSVMILVKITIDPADENLPFLVKDSIIFNTNSNIQHVKLVSWGQDAVFLSDSIIRENTTFTEDRPYVISNSLVLDSASTLTINAGTRLYFDQGAGFYVRGVVKANGSLDKPIIFNNIRSDEIFTDAPGQWDGISFLEDSRNNIINYAVIRNAVAGIQVDIADEDTLPDLILSNTIIENMSEYGLLSMTADIVAYNVLIDNCNDYLIANYEGGNYQYRHCTFTNENTDFIRSTASVIFSNNGQYVDSLHDLRVEMQNCIVTGRRTNELQLVDDGVGFDVFISNNIIKTNEPLLLTENETSIMPDFIDAFAYDFHLDTLSIAKDAGINLGINFDLDGYVRDANPDIGVYERDE